MAKRVIGLDVGYKTLRGAQLHLVGNGKPVLERLFEMAIPDGLINFGDIRDRDGFIALLRQFMLDSEFKTRKVVLSAGSLHVFARELVVPKMSELRIKESLPFLMEGILPVAPSQLILDFYPAEERVEDGVTNIHGLVVAAERPSVDALVDCVIQARFEPLAVDFIPFALLRVRLSAEAGDKTVLVADVGAGATNLVIARGPVPLFVRVIPNGGQDIDRALIFQLKMSPEQAAATKLKLKEKPEDKADLEAWEVIQKAAEDYVNTLKSTLEYYEQSHGAESGKVDNVILTGGGSELVGLRDRVELALKVPVKLDGRPINIEKAPGLSASDEKLSRFAVAIGLAMAGEK